MKPRLLVVELHHLGDAVLSLPFVNAATERYEVIVCCRPASEAVYAAARVPTRVIPWEPGWGEQGDGLFAGLAGIVRKLRAQKPDVVACVWPDSRAHLLMKLSGAPKRIGFSMNPRNYYGMNVQWRRRNLVMGRVFAAAASIVTGGKLLTEALDRGEYLQSHLEGWCQIAEALRCKRDLSPPWFARDCLRCDPAVQIFAAEARQLGKKIWLLHAGGRLATKRWPIDRFERVIRKFFAPRDIPLIVIRPPGEPIPDVTGVSRVLVSAPEDIRALAGAVDAADFVLCNDSLVSHIAAGLNKQVVTIFGSGEPRWFAPHGSEDLVVQNDVCPFHPCIDRCVMPSVVCLEAVAPERVITALHALSAGERDRAQ